MQYIDYVFVFIQNQLDDEAIFPTKALAEFPKDFHARFVPCPFTHKYKGKRDLSTDIPCFRAYFP